MYVVGYALIIVAAFVFLGASFFLQGKGGRLSFQIIGLVLFVTLALTSLDIKQEFCYVSHDNETTQANSTLTQHAYSYNCESYQVFDEASAWVFGGLGLVCALFVVITSFSDMGVLKNDNQESL